MPGWSVIKALDHSNPLGWSKVTHPYHPFRGRYFKILKTRKVAGDETLILKGTDRGTFAVLRSWTDKAEPGPYNCQDIPTSLLSFQCLLALTDLVKQITIKINKKMVDK